MKTKSNEAHCDSCGRKLAPGHLPGNHVRGDRDERCDNCYNFSAANNEYMREMMREVAERP